jgi:hypothetical protein
VISGSGTAWASTASPHEYHFFGCTGPGPSEFTAVKELLPTGSASAASAFRLVEGGTGVFVVLYFGVVPPPPGATTSEILTSSCQVTTTSLGQLTFSGFLVPAKG